MNPPEFPTGETSPTSSKKEVQLEGPRPPPIRVSKESHKIKKPPLPPQQRQPAIIYSVAPKVINVAVSDFMDVVQRLTGPSSGDPPPAGLEDLSPAARLASVEKTSPPSEKEGVHHSGDDDVTCMLEGVEVGPFPGILSPAQATLPPISSELFSPQPVSLLNDLSPFWSASSLVSGAVVSPLPSPPDLFNLFD